MGQDKPYPSWNESCQLQQPAILVSALLHLVHISWKIKKLIIWLWQWVAHAISQLLYSFCIFQGDTLCSPFLLSKAWLAPCPLIILKHSMIPQVQCWCCNAHSVQHSIFLSVQLTPHSWHNTVHGDFVMPKHPATFRYMLLLNAILTSLLKT